MKKCLTWLAALLLVFGLAACGGKAPAQTTESPVGEPSGAAADVFPEDAQLGSVSLGGMGLKEGLAALQSAAADYELVLTVNGNPVRISGAGLGLAVDEAAFDGYAQALQSRTADPAGVLTYDREVLRAQLEAALNTQVQDARITYDSGEMRFVATESVIGMDYDLDAAADAAGAAIAQLLPAAEAEVPVTETAPQIASDSQQFQSALDKANGYLQVSLTYTYAPEGKKAASETVSAAWIASFVTISDSLEVGVSKAAIESYASAMSGRHSAGNYQGSFRTTGGSTLGYQVTYYGQKLDEVALTDDIYQCLTGGVSGTRTAPYTKQSSLPYGGSYVEINLSSQHLWVYKDGKCVVSSDFVSGCVAEDHCTPTGVYSIYSKQRDRYLTGEDYRSFVNYWMPFSGGYGLHDASWRSNFGGEIYIYHGSHGCINLPSGAAKKVYNNVQVGTKVILYGGRTEADPLQQKITGTTAYKVTEGCAPFKLDAKLKYSGAQVHYSSSDPSVATVSADGTVTVHGVGTATITVSADAFEYYTAAELKIQITVTPKAEETEPTEPPKPTEPSEPTEPSKPTEPSEPTEPTKPTEPSEPEPSEPSEPEPTEPSEPAPTEETQPPTEETAP